MPKTIQSLRVAPIINKSIRLFTSVGKSGLAASLVVAIAITSFWAHTAHADTPIATVLAAVGVTTSDTAEKPQEIVVDGLTATERAAKIDAYFAQYNLPLEGYGKVFVDAADREGLDWRFVAAKAIIESTGGKFMPKGSNNPLGWGCSTAAKCIHFDSFDEAINEVTANLAGNREKTAKYYAGKTLSQKMASYNSVNPKYQTMVFRTMDKIAAIDAPSTLAMK
jgi:hypothetical protein